MSRRTSAVVLALTIPTAFGLYFSSAPTAQEAAAKARKVTKTDAEWKKLLTPQQFAVTRQKATEPPFSGKYANSHAKGTFACVCCGAPLFSSQKKFDSGTGWPSFWQPVDPKMIDAAPDYHTAEARVEVMCNNCGAHLGHVFEDGPPPTGLRYCINSLSLKLVPPAPAAKKGSVGKAADEKKADAPAEAKEETAKESK
jgi:peptide-methionine (R)-S-oxide reductase